MATYTKIPLSPEEKEILESLIETAGGMGRTTPLTALSAAQRDGIHSVHQKRYVYLTKHKFMVLLPP